MQYWRHIVCKRRSCRTQLVGDSGAGENGWQGLDLAAAARLDASAVLTRLGSSENGLSAAEATRRLGKVGPNAVRSHGANALDVLLRQVKSPLLILLVAAAGTSLVVGEQPTP